MQANSDCLCTESIFEEGFFPAASGLPWAQTLCRRAIRQVVAFGMTLQTPTAHACVSQKPQFPSFSFRNQRWSVW
jgi:hypothetical protein